MQKNINFFRENCVQKIGKICPEEMKPSLLWLVFSKIEKVSQGFSTVNLYSVRGLERSELGSHEIRPIHSAPSLEQSIHLP